MQAIELVNQGHLLANSLTGAMLEQGKNQRDALMVAALTYRILKARVEGSVVLEALQEADAIYDALMNRPNRMVS